MLTEARKVWWKALKKQLQGSRKPARGTKGEVEAFDCDKSANLVPKNVKKVEIWPKRHPKCERTRVWKCRMTVYGTIPSVVDPQDTSQPPQKLTLVPKIWRAYRSPKSRKAL